MGPSRKGTSPSSFPLPTRPSPSSSGDSPEQNNRNSSTSATHSAANNTASTATHPSGSGSGSGPGPSRKPRRHRLKPKHRRQSFAISHQPVDEDRLFGDTATATAPLIPAFRLPGDSSAPFASPVADDHLHDHRFFPPRSGPDSARTRFSVANNAERSPSYSLHTQDEEPEGSERLPTLGRDRDRDQDRRRGRDRDLEDQKDQSDHDDDNDDPSHPLLGSTLGNSVYGTAHPVLPPASASAHRPPHPVHQSSHGLYPPVRRSSSYPDFPDVNNPSSVPPSPRLLAHPSTFPDHEDASDPNSHHQLPDVALDMNGPYPSGSPIHFHWPGNVADDVCFPTDNEPMAYSGLGRGSRRHRSHLSWPNLAALEAFCANEQSVRAQQDTSRMRAAPEPIVINGRLRSHPPWHNRPEDAPFRFTYFNAEISDTIHSQTLSDLLQPNRTFRDLFIPEPVEPAPSSQSSDGGGGGGGDDDGSTSPFTSHRATPIDNGSKKTLVNIAESPAHSSKASSSTAHNNAPPPARSGLKSPAESTGRSTPALPRMSFRNPDSQAQSRERPTFWLDILSPTVEEMRAVSKTFGLHPLTVEDILQQDAREKVEIFNNYYFVNYCSFEQDILSENFMEPLNFYAVVFRQGILTFHFSQTPHPANVRRRIRQLADYIMVSADWISYALIDDITDTYGPLIEGIKDEVEEVDDAILRMHSSMAKLDFALNKKTDKSSQLARPRAAPDGCPNCRRSSWWGRSGMLGWLGLRRRMADSDQLDGRPDPERLGMGMGMGMGMPMGIDRRGRRPSSVGISRSFTIDATGVPDPLSTGMSRSGLWRRRPSRPSRSDYREWHPVTKATVEKSDTGSVISARGDSDALLLLQIGECRKKVMSLFRLLGAKANVIKSFAKRCNEQYSVAPHSEIGMYLSDIQDHIVTMTNNLEHYELLLSRAHSNYFALINLRVTQRSEETNDVLNKLTVLGTIVLPMNIITGMWGMNVLVPGQGADDSLQWFWSITGGLALFGIIAFFVAKKMFGIV